jgi:hypothetical protein
MHRFFECSAAVLCWLCLSSPFASAASPAVAPAMVEEGLIVDTAFDRLSPSLFRLDFQRLPQPGENIHWINPDPDGPSLSVRPGKTLFDTSVLWIDPYEVERVMPVRAAAVAPVLSAVSGDSLLRTLLREAADAAGAPHGIRYPRSTHSGEAGKAQVAAVLKDRDSGTVTVVRTQPVYMYAPYTGPVALSWDDRQVLISVRIQRYRKVRGKHMTIRDLGPPIDIHYVGASVPEGHAPIDWWSENGGARLRAELRNGFRRIFESALGTSEAIEAPRRGELTAVQVGDRVERFSGTLVDEVDGLARFAQGKRTLLLVSTTDAY